MQQNNLIPFLILKDTHKFCSTQLCSPTRVGSAASTLNLYVLFKMSSGIIPFLILKGAYLSGA